MQKLHEGLTSEELNSHLDGRAVVVWVNRTRTPFEERYDVVLDHPETSDEYGAILGWLQSINPGAIDEAMLKGARLSQSPGTVALQALMEMAGLHPG